MIKSKCFNPEGTDFLARRFWAGPIESSKRVSFFLHVRHDCTVHQPLGSSSTRLPLGPC